MFQNSPDRVKIMSYVDRNPAAVLGTVGEDGAPHGAVVYIFTTSDNNVCFVTKNATKKFANLSSRPKVSLTFFNEKESSTLQAQGRAFIADDPHMVDYVLDKTAKANALRSDWLPPVTKLHDGEYAVIGIELESARLAEYQGMGIGGGTFTELK